MRIIYLVAGEWNTYKAFASKEKAQDLSDQLWEENKIYTEVVKIWFDDEA